jgi:hypothetical protein
LRLDEAKRVGYGFALLLFRLPTMFQLYRLPRNCIKTVQWKL